MDNEAGQKGRAEKSRLVHHRTQHVAKRDVGDRGRQSIERPGSDLERPKRRHAALAIGLGHRVIIWSALFWGHRLGVRHARLIAKLSLLVDSTLPFTQL